ncbi:Uncharacterised protein [Bordetella ansorpii]|uniref:Uncharacterized protein n=1 Tax=Bordetella ansorpii TaxID=288768 RepID=A0A157RN79_9BORD|nr:Uncharacterised protein [Bordetella ansorpii]
MAPAAPVVTWPAAAGVRVSPPLRPVMAALIAMLRAASKDNVLPLSQVIACLTTMSPLPDEPSPVTSSKLVWARLVTIVSADTLPPLAMSSTIRSSGSSSHRPVCPPLACVDTRVESAISMCFLPEVSTNPPLPPCPPSALILPENFAVFPAMATTWPPCPPAAVADASITPATSTLPPVTVTVPPWLAWRASSVPVDCTVPVSPAVRKMRPPLDAVPVALMTPCVLPASAYTLPPLARSSACAARIAPLFNASVSPPPILTDSLPSASAASRISTS